MVVSELQSHPYQHGDYTRSARAVGVTTRGLRYWRKRPGGRPGRPAHSQATCVRAFRAVARAWVALHHVGWTKIHEVLGDTVPVRLVHKALREVNRLHRAHAKRHIDRNRQHVEVLAANVMWHEDATHLGRAPEGEVEGDLVKDAAVPELLVVSVGGAVTGADAVANLESAIAASGGVAPLAHVTDNGPAYRSKEFADCLRRHRIIHLLNLPHTPQHNARAERAVRDLKEVTELGCGAHLEGVDDAASRVADGLEILALRAAICPLPPAAPVLYNSEQRDRFYKTCRMRRMGAVQGIQGTRARRRAVREATYAVLEEHELIKRTRGGAPMLAVKAERKA